jgi:hypothetical protein
MKLYKYWVTEKQKILIDGQEQEITCYGGSNNSIDEARARAKEKFQKVQRKIRGEKHLFDEYEVEIREEILQVVDNHSAITRNRYGAQVLNAEQLMILDIDKPKPSFGDLFKKKEAASEKVRIFDMVRKLTVTSKYRDYSYRIYETHQGARVMVLGKSFDPRQSETQRMMSDFNCDPLYTRLCVKQGCYRARLTPKPYRMDLRPYKVKFPREEEDPEFQQWLTIYEAASRNFNVCRLVDQIGPSQALSETVRLHDEISGVNFRQPLA